MRCSFCVWNFLSLKFSMEIFSLKLKFIENKSTFPREMLVSMREWGMVCCNCICWKKSLNNTRSFWLENFERFYENVVFISHECICWWSIQPSQGWINGKKVYFSVHNRMENIHLFQSGTSFIKLNILNYSILVHVAARTFCCNGDCLRY